MSRRGLRDKRGRPPLAQHRRKKADSENPYLRQADRIDRCLGCTAPDCSNCYSQPAGARKKKLHGEDKI